MTYDINSIDELVDALEGNSGVADLINSGDAAVSNWKSRGYVPPSRHLTILIECKKRGLTLDPAVLDRTPGDFAILFGGHLATA